MSFKICPLCKKENNPSFSVCWKCKGALVDAESSGEVTDLSMQPRTTNKFATAIDDFQDEIHKSLTVNDDNLILRQLLFVAAVSMFLAVLPIGVAGFYVFLRLLVFGVLIYAIYRVKDNAVLKSHTVPMILIAIIFNPFIPIYLYNKLLWAPLNIGGGVYFLLLMKKFK